MEFIATIIAAAFKSIWGLPVLLILVGIVFFPIYNILQEKIATGQRKISLLKEKKKRKNLFDLKAGYWALFKLAAIFAIPIGLFFGRSIYRPITEKYGVTTEAVMYKVSDPGIIINYDRVYKYHFVFQLPDSTYQKASMLDYQMQRGYGVNQRATIKYLPLTASFYPIIVDVKE